MVVPESSEGHSHCRTGLSIRAPIMERGRMIRPIGQELSESSPERNEVKDCALKIPEISRVVVPLFPTLRVARRGSKAVNPFPLDENPSVGFLLNIYSHLPETTDGREAVCTVQEVVDGSGTSPGHQT